MTVVTLPPPGTVFEVRRALSQRAFDTFAAVSGDNNPIHVDPDFSARTRFGRTVAHGMLLYAVLWGLVRHHLPGARQVGQTLMFPAPAYADEELRFALRVTKTAEDGTCTLAARVTRVADGEIVLDGETVVALDGAGQC